MNNNELRKKRDHLVANIMNNEHEAVFESPEEVRVISADLALQELLGNERFVNVLAEYAKNDKSAKHFLRLEVMKLVTQQVHEALNDYE